MKQLLIATAALSLIGGVAFAQMAPATAGGASTPSNPPSSATSDPGSNTAGSMAPAPATSSSNPPSSATSDPGSNTAGSMAPAPAASTAATSSNPPSSATSDPGSNTPGSMAAASNAPADAASTTYPVCTSKHEDHCVNRSQATRMASASHVKKTKHSAAPAPAPST